jgi:hypothetical protein
LSRLAKAGVAALLGVAGLSIGGCASTAYGPMNGGVYGYSDTPIECGGHSIRVVLPSHAEDPQVAYAHWNRRAEELCDGAIARKQIHTAQQQVLPNYNRLSGVVGDYVLEGYVWCGSSADAAPAPAAP